MMDPHLIQQQSHVRDRIRWFNRSVRASTNRLKEEKDFMLQVFEKRFGNGYRQRLLNGCDTCDEWLPAFLMKILPKDVSQVVIDFMPVMLAYEKYVHAPQDLANIALIFKISFALEIKEAAHSHDFFFVDAFKIWSPYSMVAKATPDLLAALGFMPYLRKPKANMINCSDMVHFTGNLTLYTDKDKAEDKGLSCDNLRFMKHRLLNIFAGIFDREASIVCKKVCEEKIQDLDKKRKRMYEHAINKLRRLE